MGTFEWILMCCVGIGLAAACGFRVFVPLLLVSLASHAEYLELSSGFAWMGSTPALICFAVATAMEISAYYIPWVDNMLDAIATPAAMIAGTILTAAMISGMDPMLQWALAIIAGGGAAIATQGMTVATRAASTLSTGGLGNPVVNTVETGISFTLAALAIIVPVAALLLVGLLVLWLLRIASRKFVRGVHIVANPRNPHVSA